MQSGINETCEQKNISRQCQDRHGEKLLQQTALFKKNIKSQGSNTLYSGILKRDPQILVSI